MEELDFKNFRHDAFVGISAPCDTPKSVIAILNKSLNEALSLPALQKRLAKFGMAVPAAPNTPEPYGKFMADQVAYQGELAKLPGGCSSKIVEHGGATVSIIYHYTNQKGPAAPAKRNLA